MAVRGPACVRGYAPHSGHAAECLPAETAKTNVRNFTNTTCKLAQASYLHDYTNVFYCRNYRRF